jgi:hypothetical protein
VLLGALHVSATAPADATADDVVGAAGDVIGVAVTAAELALAFALVVPVTVTEYAVPPVRPSKVTSKSVVAVVPIPTVAATR